MGDFNIDLLKTESCDFSNRFSEQRHHFCLLLQLDQLG